MKGPSVSATGSIDQEPSANKAKDGRGGKEEGAQGPATPNKESKNHRHERQRPWWG